MDFNEVCMKKAIRLLLIPALLATMTGCEDILDKEPTDRLSLEETFKDVAGVKTALRGSYRSLLALESYHRNLMIYPDMAGGNIKYSRGTTLQLEDLYNFRQSAEESSMNATYTEAYALLNNLNNLLAYTPDAIHGTQQEKNRIMAEARSLRALTHFNLVRLYAQPYAYTPGASHVGIVLNLKPRLYNDPLPVRASVTDSYQSIITDLTEAMDLFDQSTTINNGNGKTYFSKNAAKALLAKVYLYQGDWASAYQHADEVIRGGGYTLLSGEEYVGSWETRTPSSESIFEIALEQDFSGTSLGSYFDPVASEQMFAATEDILQLYSETDVRGRTSLYNTRQVSGQTFYLTRKYGRGSFNATPIKILRLSELYLIRAEAAAELGNLEQAAQDLNTIRLRADAEFTPEEGMDQAALRDAILLERRKELAFEGNLYFDLRRRMLPITRTDCAAQVCSLEPNDPRLVLPLPKATTDVNPDLKQNDGY